MFICPQKVFYTIEETCQQESLPKSVITQLMADPRFAAITLTEGGKILIAKGAIGMLLEAREKCSKVQAEQFLSKPNWNWNLPNVQYLRRVDLEVLFGISRATSYTLVHSEGFPVDPLLSSTRMYIQTDELKEWLDNRAMRFHSIYKERRKK